MVGIPRYRPHAGPALFSAGFRPFFLAAALWAALAIPLWLAAYARGAVAASVLPPALWHGHEMVFGFAIASVAGFLLTAIPNWTGRMPLQGWPLAALVLLWAAGRLAVLGSAEIGVQAAAAIDLAFPLAFLLTIAREILTGRNWRNLPMLAALALLLLGSLLVHLEALGVAQTGELGNRLGLATLLLLISLMGGRIIPSFTRNWLVKMQPQERLPAAAGVLDTATLVLTALGLAVWVGAPDGEWTPWAELLAGIAVAVRLARWRGLATMREPLLVVLHVGYGWLACGLLLLALNGFWALMPASDAVHALSIGAVGTMTLAVMTRASLGHTGRPLTAGPGTKAIFLLVTTAALLRLAVPLSGDHAELLLALAGLAWSGAFGLFALLYGRPLSRPRVSGTVASPI